MSDKSSVATSWSKSNNDNKPQSNENIIVPNEDVFDLKDYINSENNAGSNTNPEETYKPIIDPVAPHHTQTINPEQSRSQKEEKYFYQSGHKNKPKDTSNWFIVTFLMTVVILGFLYFFFALEDKNNQISGLERQLSNKADNRVKGVLEIKNPDSQNDTTESKSDFTQSADGFSDKNFSILADLNSLNFKIEKTNVSIDYLNNQIGTKTSLVKITSLDGKTYRDIIDIYTAEKQSVFDKSTIVANILKIKNDFVIDQDNLKSKNGLNITSLKTKNSEVSNKIYVGVSENFTYVIESSNPSRAITPQSKLNDFISNIISNISLN